MKAPVVEPATVIPTRPHAATLPESLPGDFHVLEWQSEAERYIVHTDDAGRSSYDLGGELRAVKLQYRRWGFDEATTDDLIDAAREFHLAQFVHATRRILRTPYPLDAQGRRVVLEPKLSFEEPRNAWIHSV